MQSLPLMFITALVLAVGPSVAVGKSAPAQGVHVDPGSPAAKEYAIPLSQARGGGASGGSGSGQLFGRGITRTPSAPPAAASTGAPPVTAIVPAPVARSRGRTRRVARHAVVRPRVVRRQHVAPAAAVPASESSAPFRIAGGGGSGVVWMLGVAALVLALGGLGGAVLARHSRGTEHAPELM